MKKIPPPPKRLTLKDCPKVIYLKGLKFEKVRPEARGEFPQYVCNEYADKKIILRLRAYGAAKGDALECVATVLWTSVDLSEPVLMRMASMNPDRAVREAWKEFGIRASREKLRNLSRIAYLTNMNARLDLDVLPLFPKKRTPAR